MLNKKLMTAGMIGLLAIGMVGCGNKTETPVENDTNVEQQTNKEENTTKEEAVEVDVAGTIAKIKTELEGKMPMTMELDHTDEKMTLAYQESLTADMVEDFAGLMPMMQSTTEVALFKAKDGDVQTIIKALEERQANQIKVFEQYLPDQYEIIKESKIVDKGDYVYFISAEPENFEIMQTIIEDAIAGK